MLPQQILTSISPTRIEEQKKAMLTWEKFDIPIKTIQCEGEEYAKEFGYDHCYVKPSTWWSKRTPSITNLLQFVDRPTLYINSDVEMDMDNLDWWEVQPETFRIGIRTDYCRRWTQLNKYGIDVFLFTEEMVEILDNPLWALGIPGWDYYVIWKLIESDYKVEIFKEDILHAAHVEQWNDRDYRKCGKLLEFEFDISIQDLTDKLQLLTDRWHLLKKRYRSDLEEALAKKEREEQEAGPLPF